MGLSLARWALKIYEHILWSKFKRLHCPDRYSWQTCWLIKRSCFSCSVHNLCISYCISSHFIAQTLHRRHSECAPNCWFLVDGMGKTDWCSPHARFFHVNVILIYINNPRPNPPQTYFWESFCILVLLSKLPNWKQIHVGNAHAPRYCQTNS